jgi:rubrerythrin
MQTATGVDRKLSLQCASCGYGVAGSVPPERCPMCGRPVVWNHTLWRPFSTRTG